MNAIIQEAITRGGMPDQSRLAAAFLSCGGFVYPDGTKSCANPVHQAAAQASADAVQAALLAKQQADAAAALAAQHTTVVPLPPSDQIPKTTPGTPPAGSHDDLLTILPDSTPNYGLLALVGVGLILLTGALKQ